MEYLSFPGLSPEVTRGLVSGTITVFGAVGVCGLIGNVILILSVIRQSDLRSSPTYITLVSLAMSDTSLILFLPYHMYVLYKGDVGDNGCKLFLYGIFTASGCSTYHLVGFSILRYVILVKPLFALKYMTVKLTMMMCFAIWFMAFSGSALTLGISGLIVFNSSFTNASVPVCTITGSSTTILIALVSYMALLPLTLISCFHITKAYYIRHRKIESESPVQKQQVSTKLIIGIVVMFMLSNIPGGVGWFLLLNGPCYQSLEAAVLVYLLSALPYVNSSLDPFLYFIITRKDKRKSSTSSGIYN